MKIQLVPNCFTRLILQYLGARFFGTKFSIDCHLFDWRMLSIQSTASNPPPLHPYLLLTNWFLQNNGDKDSHVFRILATVLLQVQMDTSSSIYILLFNIVITMNSL